MTRNILTAGFALVLAAVSASPAPAQEGAGIVQVTPPKYPADYGYQGSVYLVLDKSETGDDAAIVLRDGGNARAEIGIVSDNDIHIKRVSGQYPDETFTDAVVIRADSGFVDVVEKLRAFAASGKPVLIVGNSDGQASGAGVEIEYDHEARQGNIRVVERGHNHRPLAINARSLAWHVGRNGVNQDPAMEISSYGVAHFYGGVQITRNDSHPGGAFGQGMIYRDEGYGLVVVGAEGENYDMLLANRSGGRVIAVPAGTRDVELYGTLTLAGNPAEPGHAATKAYVDAAIAAAVAEALSKTCGAPEGEEEDLTPAEDGGTVGDNR